MNRQTLNLKHVHDFEPKPMDKVQEIDLESLLDMTREGAAVADALLENGKIIAIIGFVFLWAGVANVFVIPSVHIPNAKISFVLHIKSELKRVMKQYGIRRAQTNSISDPAIDRWMTILGFECEGLRKEYSADKRDYKAWARFS